MSQRMKLLYYTGSCHESVQAREQIKSNFLIVINKYLQKTGQGSCSDPNNNNICKAENVRIVCGQVQSRKRSTQVSHIKENWVLFSTRRIGSDFDSLSKAVSAPLNCLLEIHKHCLGDHFIPKDHGKNQFAILRISNQDLGIMK